MGVTLWPRCACAEWGLGLQQPIIRILRYTAAAAACRHHDISSSQCVTVTLVLLVSADGWQPWLHGSCAAAVAVLGVIQLQSMSSNKTAHSKTPCSNGLGPANAHNSKQQQSQHGVVTGGHIPMAVKPGLAGTAAVPSLLAVAVLLCSLALASKPQQQHQWPLVSQQLAALQAAVASFSLAGLQLCGWAVLAAVSFCLALQLLPGCFSLGEAALMAQGAACLTVTAAKALQHAALFVPSAVCSQLPRSALTAAQGMGGCMAESHKAALSLLGLPAVISLVLAAAVVACLLLTALYWSVKGSRQQQQVRSLQDLQKQGQSVSAGCALSNGTSTAHALRSSGTFAGPSPATVVVNVAAAIVAAAGICMVLLWLTCAAAWTLLEFLPAEAGRLGVLLYWVGLLAVTLPALKWLARAGSMPQVGVIGSCQARLMQRSIIDVSCTDRLHSINPSALQVRIRVSARSFVAASQDGRTTTLPQEGS